MQDFSEIKKKMVDRGTRYFNQVNNAKERIAKDAMLLISKSKHVSTSC